MDSIKQDRKNFRNILERLARDPIYCSDDSSANELRVKTIGDLVSLYVKVDFRHFYSDIFDVMDKNMRIEDRETLVYNIEVLYETINSKNNEWSENADLKSYWKEFQKRFNKLYDHVMLEALRISSLENYPEIVEQHKKEVKEFIGRKNELENQIQSMKKEIEETTEQMNESQKASAAQSITVLSIFTGIAMTFFGGVSLASGVLTALNNRASLSRLTFLILLVGFILFNTVFVLIYCSAKISDKDISVHCKKQNCDECMECKSIYSKLKNKYPYIVYVNIIMSISLIVTFVYIKRIV